MTEATFVACAASGHYDHVPAAERCSLDVARGLGAYDADAWFADPFAATTKTQSEDAVASAGDATRSATLCSGAEDPALAHVAFPLCGVSAGVHAAREESPDGTASCVTADCPPGFTQEGDACVRPSQPRSMAQASRCDERWYDWFNVENAHLGNGVGAAADGTCFGPCPAGFVPNVNVNPVDGSLLSVTGASDPTTCVPKSEFAFGAYARTPEYAPLAWVHRLTARPEDFVRATESAVDALSHESAAGVAEGSRDAASRNATADAGALYTAMDAATDAVIAASAPSAPSAAPAFPAIAMGARYLSAGKSLNAPDRLRYAVAVCKQVRDNPDGFLKKWASSWGARSDARMALLRQACHLTCCDANSMASIGEQPLCFDAKVLRNAGGAAVAKATAAKAKADAAQKKRDDALAERGVGTPGELAFYSALRPAVLLGVLPVLAVVLLLVVGPLVLWAWRAFLTGWDPKKSAAENSTAAVERATIQGMWVSRLGQALSRLGQALGAVYGQAMGAFRWAASGGAWVVGGVAPVLKDAAGNVAGNVTNNLLGKTLAGLSVVIVIVLVFVLAMFIFFYVTVRDVRLGGGYTGFDAFLNAFNYHDWQIFNWREMWLVRVTNEFLNPYRSMLSSEATPRPPLPAGRCDNVAWVGDGAGACHASVLPAPIEWTLSYPEGGSVPSVLRAPAPTSVSVPYLAEGDRFVASCAVSVPGADPDAPARPLLVPAPGDPNSCLRVRTALPAYSDAYRPKRGATGWAGLDGYADASQPRC